MIKGLGYKSIAIVVGTSRDNVRYYCRTHGLDGKADDVKRRFAEHRKNPEVCKQCGQRIVRTRHSGKKIFCCDECRRMWWKEHQEKSVRSKDAFYNFQCACCGNYFTAYGNKHRKYCSHDCYILDRFWKDPDREITVVRTKNRRIIKKINSTNVVK